MLTSTLLWTIEQKLKWERASMMCGYPVKFSRDDDGSIIAVCPLLLEATAFGEDHSTALFHAGEAIEEAVAARISDWQPVPPPRERRRGDRGFAMLPMQTILKIELYRAVRAADITRAELQRRLRWHREQVDRLFRLDHASRLDQMEAAFAAAGADVQIVVRTRESA